MRCLTLFVIASVAVAVPTACGGASDPHDLLGGGGSSSSIVVDAAFDTGQGHSSSGGNVDASAPPVPTVDSGSGESVDTGTGIPEASPPETGGGGTAFSCPPTTCGAPDVCCATNTGQGNNATYKCQSASKACGDGQSPGSPISCATTADCNVGEVCCGENDNKGFYDDVSCQPTCTGQGNNGSTLVQFCDPAADDCPFGTICQASQVLTGFNVCN